MHIDHAEFHDHFVRGLTHKMNNILTLFNGYLGVLLEEPDLPPVVVEGLARMQEGARAASELMERTRILATPHTLIWREVDLPKFFLLLKPSLDAFIERGVRLELQCPEGLPSIWADPSRLRTALIEVVRNAIEASPDDGVVVITIKDEHRQTAGSTSATRPITWASITVTDQGHGISPENRPRIFTPFFSTKTDQNAAGLGLTVAVRAIEQLGGSIQISSRPGRTSVRILMPSRAGISPRAEPVEQA